MKLAKASVEEAETLLRWLQAHDHAKFEHPGHRPPAFSRTICGYLLLLEHCADPAKDYLDFKPGTSPAEIRVMRDNMAKILCVQPLPTANNADLWQAIGEMRRIAAETLSPSPALAELNQTLNAEIEKRDSNPPFSP